MKVSLSCDVGDEIKDLRFRVVGGTSGTRSTSWHSCFVCSKSFVGDGLGGR